MITSSEFSLPTLLLFITSTYFLVHGLTLSHKVLKRRSKKEIEKWLLNWIIFSNLRFFTRVTEEILGYQSVLYTISFSLYFCWLISRSTKVNELVDKYCLRYFVLFLAIVELIIRIIIKILSYILIVFVYIAIILIEFLLPDERKTLKTEIQSEMAHLNQNDLNILLDNAKNRKTPCKSKMKDSNQLDYRIQKEASKSQRKPGNKYGRLSTEERQKIKESEGRIPEAEILLPNNTKTMTFVSESKIKHANQKECLNFLPDNVRNEEIATKSKIKDSNQFDHRIQNGKSRSQRKPENKCGELIIEELQKTEESENRIPQAEILLPNNTKTLTFVPKSKIEHANQKNRLNLLTDNTKVATQSKHKIKNSNENNHLNQKETSISQTKPDVKCDAQISEKESQNIEEMEDIFLQAESLTSSTLTVISVSESKINRSCHQKDHLNCLPDKKISNQSKYEIQTSDQNDHLYQKYIFNQKEISKSQRKSEENVGLISEGGSQKIQETEDTFLQAALQFLEF